MATGSVSVAVDVSITGRTCRARGRQSRRDQRREPFVPKVKVVELFEPYCLKWSFELESSNTTLPPSPMCVMLYKELEREYFTVSGKWLRYSSSTRLLAQLPSSSKGLAPQLVVRWDLFATTRDCQSRYKSRIHRQSCQS